MKRKFILAVGLACVFVASAQEIHPLSLQQCIEMAIDKNIHVVQTRMDKEKSLYKTQETRAALLPQISGAATYVDNLKMSKVLLPGDMLGAPGTYIPLSMGVEYNANAGVALNQVLFNQTAFMGLKLSRKAEEISQLSVEKAEENIAKEITNLYFLTLTTAEQVEIIRENIQRNEKIAAITKVIVENGFGKQVDYDRMIVNIENQYTQLNNVEALYQQQLNMMKYMLEIPIQTDITLIGSPNVALISDPTPMNDFSHHVDMRLLSKQTDIYALNRKIIQSQYLPNLMFNSQWGISGMRNDFKDLFRSGEANKWFNSYSIGLTVSVPIFDGFEKRSRSRQAKIDYDQSLLTYTNMQNKMEVDYQNALKDYFNNRKNVERQLQNINLAEKTYAETSLKYREGMATMSDLLQDQTGLSDAQNNYLNALYSYKVAELELMELSGEISTLYQSTRK